MQDGNSGMDFLTLAEKASALSLPTLLILILVGGYRKWWVWGWQLKEAETRCDALLSAANVRETEWKDMALTGGRLADKAVGLVKAQRGQ